MYVIIIGLVALAGFFYLYKEKGLSLSADEQIIINSIVAEKQKILADFMAGKEAVLSMYESLKADVEKAVGLQAKLPVSPIISSPAPQSVLPVNNILPSASAVAVEAPIVAEPAPPISEPVLNESPPA